MSLSLLTHGVYAHWSPISHARELESRVKQGTASHPLYSGLKDTRALAGPRCYFSPDSLGTVGVGGGVASRTFESPKKSRAASVFSALLSFSLLS